MSLPSRGGGQPEYLAIARVNAVYGLRGELRATILSDFPERFANLAAVYVGPVFRRYNVESHRLQKQQVLLKLAGVDNATQAEALRGQLLYVPLAEAVKLPEGQYYWHDIIGLAVETTEGDRLGTIADIIRTGSNDVYVVTDGQREILIPAIEDVVAKIDLAGRHMTIRAVPGLLE